MFGGLYTAASGILAHQREIDVIGDNLVNATTPGYSADRVVLSSFEKELLTRMDAGGNTTLGNGSGAPSVVVDKTVLQTNSGTLKNTGKMLDVAVSNGYFTIAGKDGKTYYTRNGNFEMDEEGYLSLSGLGKVMGTGGPIKLDTSEGITIDEKGMLYNAAGAYINQLQISDIPAGTVVEKLDNGAFLVQGGGAMGAAANYTVYQRTLELSNVDTNQEMTLLIRAQRSFQSCSSALQIADEMDQKAATQIASI